MEKSSTYDNKLNILVAFPYFSNGIRKELEKQDPERFRLIVDSGAFSAHNSGHEIKLDDYCDFITGLQPSFPDMEYVQLDVVFDEQGTKDNYQEMLRRGFDPCPVFTRGASQDYFKELLALDKYIFVGGVQRGKGAPNFAKWVLENSGGYKEHKVHLLAFVRPDFINHYKPYSVDASSWTSAARYGQLLYYTKGRLKSMHKKDFAKMPKQAFLDSCKELKIPFNVVKKLRLNGSWKSTTKFVYDEDPNTPSETLGLFINTLNYIYYSIKAQNEVGTKIYMAVGDSSQLRLMFQCYDFLKERGVI